MTTEAWRAALARQHNIAAPVADERTYATRRMQDIYRARQEKADADRAAAERKKQRRRRPNR